MLYNALEKFKPNIAEMEKKFPSFYDTRRQITVLNNSQALDNNLSQFNPGCSHHTTFLYY
jgi:hypothetical protein